MGLRTVVGKAFVKTISLGFGLTLLPLTIILHMVGYRRVTIFTDRIGHLALEPDCLLKEQTLGQIARRKWILLAPAGRVANEHLLTYWRPYFRIVRNRAACFVIASMSRWGLMRHDVARYARAFDKAQQSFRVYADWGNRPPLLQLTTDDKIWGETMLKEIGLPQGAWYVCVHAREQGFSPIDEELQYHRNCSIDKTIPAIRKIIRRGGWVVRIGDPTMKPFAPMPKVIDYAHHPLKSPRLDVILCANARFILGSTSGICLVGTLFGVPSAIANMVPPADLWYGLDDISIPKRVWHKRESRYLTVLESFAYPHGCYRYARQYVDSDLALVENAPEDIEDLADEMLDRLESRLVFTPEDFSTIESYRAIMDERYTSYYSKASVGVKFSRKYKDTGLPIPPIVEAKQ